MSIKTLSDKRIDFHNTLVAIQSDLRVYYQPPATVKMEYPAIVYSRRDIGNSYADDNVYSQGMTYEVIVIDKDPDSVIVEKVSKLPKCRFERSYVYDNLYHTVFTIFQ